MVWAYRLIRYNLLKYQQLLKWMHVYPLVVKIWILKSCECMSDTDSSSAAIQVHALSVKYLYSSIALMSVYYFK